MPSASPAGDATGYTAAMQQNISAKALEFPHVAPPAPGSLIEIAPGVRWFRLPLPYRLDHVNIYLIEDADGWTVLDTGLGTDACRSAWESILSGPQWLVSASPR